MKSKVLAVVSILLFAGTVAPADDWPTVHHDVARSGRTGDEVGGPYAKRWVRFFPGEIMTTRMEAIVADGRVFVGTYSGNLYALNADTGETLWKFPAGGPILHSPAVAEGVVFFGCEDGLVRALDAKSCAGRLRYFALGRQGNGLSGRAQWRFLCHGCQGRRRAVVLRNGWPDSHNCRMQRRQDYLRLGRHARLLHG
jgi:hypothetical protein